MALNINREVEDTFYRYKMPKLTAKVEGKGNGIKTVIVNVSDIAKALNRKPIYLTKFFGCELGAQIHVDEKNERYIVNGAHDAAKLQELLDGFIKKFVLCQSCGNPETTMHVKKSGVVGTTCKACGNQGQLDGTHRLTQYIVKDPPQNDYSSSKTKSKKGKKSKNGDQHSDEDNESRIAAEETHRRSPVSSTTNAENIDDSVDDDWVEDTTEEAQLQRMNELSAMAKSLALSIDVEKSETERADVFYKHLRQLVENNEVVSCRREIRLQADSLELGPRAVLVLVEALLCEASTLISDIKKYAPVFLLFTRVGDSSKRCQYYVLEAMTKLIERYNLLPKSCYILKALYDSNVLEEDEIYLWYEKGPSKKFVSRELSTKILAQCAPMIKWLKEAEEESDESSTTEDELSEKNQSPQKFGIESQEKASNDVIESEDDIDIDAI